MSQGFDMPHLTGIGSTDRLAGLASPAGRGTAGLGAGAVPGVKETAETFGSAMVKALGDVNALQTKADHLTEDFVTGATDDIAQVMLATERAHLSLQFTLELRNKVLEAYQEIIRMQL
ncbi:MAG: flagellar hook-basal body complex protein FliE [Thermaerobacterales bacterium]